VNARADDDALSWDGDDDPTLDVGAGARDAQPAAAESPRSDDVGADTDVPLADGYTAVGKGSEHVISASEAEHRAAERDAADSENGPAAMGNAGLIGIGILGGVYLLYTIGWIVGGLRLQGKAQYLVADIMFQGSFWLAVIAPLVWFATVFLLTARSRAWIRFVWLIGGAILLVPWPFIMTGVVGQ
jgi:hypothetical protein